jgi:glutamate/tyrosine decarboxylase-like PLP-dependent enzyme
MSSQTGLNGKTLIGSRKRHGGRAVFNVYAALRFLGRRGIAELVDRCCRLARRMAQRLSEDPVVSILNDVVLIRCWCVFPIYRDRNSDEFTAEVIRRVQEEGTCWLGGTTWHGLQAMRILGFKLVDDRSGHRQVS